MRLTEAKEDAGSSVDRRLPSRRPTVRGPLLLTKAEAAERLGVSVRTVERLVAAGRLPQVRVEGSARFRVGDLEAYVDALPSGSDSD